MADDPQDPEETETSDASPPEASEDSGIVRAVLGGGGDGGGDEPPVDGPLDDLVRGTTVGSYVILSRLSAVDGDVVYAAFDARSDRKVALKVVDVPDEDEDDAQARREGMIAGATRVGGLDHPSIVAVLDAGTVGTAVYVSMEFIDGIDLRQWMEARDEPFPWPEVLRVFREAGAGLAAAHAAGSVHGDFTPSRVFMEKSGRICVFDFGLATPVAEVSSPRLSVQSLKEGLGVNITNTGDDEGSGDDSIVRRPARQALVGTPSYLAPELHAGIEPDAKADQFAFCAAMYEALYGEVPFKGDSPGTIAKEALNHAVRPAPEDSDVPQWLRDVLVKGLSPRRRDRYPSMEVLLRELEHDPPARRRRWVVGLGALAGVAAVAGGITYLVQREASRCEADAGLLEGAWDPSTRAALEEAFLGVGTPHAADTWEQVQASMDDWSAQWLQYHSLACIVRQADDDESLLIRRNACLEGVLQPFALFSNNVADVGPSAQTLDGAQRVVTGLWRPADCRSRDMLDYAVPSDAGPKRAVDRAWLQLLAGELDGARATALEAVQRMPAGEATVPLVRGKLVAGLAAARSGASDAPALLHDAAAAASAASLRIPQAEAWIALGRVDAPANRPVALEHAQTLVDAIKIDRLRAQLLVARGAHERTEGRDQDALASYHRALALLQDNDTRSTISRSDILLELGELANSREEWTTASQYLREVVSIREGAFGPSHPELIGPLHELGRAHAGASKHDDAARAFDRALEIANNGRPSPRVLAAVLMATAELELSRDQHALASSHYAEAVTALEGTKSDAMLADALFGLGLARLDAGAPATAPLERAVVLASRVGWDPQRRSAAQEALGRSLLDGDPEAALEAFRKALETAPEDAVGRLERAIGELEPEGDEAGVGVP